MNKINNVLVLIIFSCLCMNVFTYGLYGISSPVVDCVAVGALGGCVCGWVSFLVCFKCYNYFKLQRQLRQYDTEAQNDVPAALGRPSSSDEVDFE